MSGNILKVIVNHAEPVELDAFSQSLRALSRRWTREIKTRDIKPLDEELNLYIKTITSGSIVVDLTNIAQNVVTPLLAVAASHPKETLDTLNGSAEFVGRLKDVFEYFLKRNKKPKELTTKDCDDAYSIVAPITNQAKGSYIIQATDNAKVSITINVSSSEAKTIQKRAKIEKEILKEPSEQKLTKVPFYWFQAEAGPARTEGSSPDKGIVEKIAPNRPLKVFFDKQQLKDKMLTGEENPFGVWWLVDLLVYAVNGKLSAYRILAIHGKAELED